MLTGLTQRSQKQQKIQMVLSSSLPFVRRSPSSIFGATPKIYPDVPAYAVDFSTCVLCITISRETRSDEHYTGNEETLAILLLPHLIFWAAASLGFLWRLSWICKLLSALTQLSEKVLSSQ